ncbi:MAG: hypothetical protein ABFQ62_02785 [Patescibacteria group bacterium]
MKFNTKTLQGLKRRQALMYVMLFSLVTIVIWAVFSLFSSQKKVPIPPELLKLAQPLNPNIDTQIIEKLEHKKEYTNSELKNFPIYTVIVNTQTRDINLVTIDKAEAQEEEKRQEQEKIRQERLATPKPTPSTEIIPVDLETTKSAESN